MAIFLNENSKIIVQGMTGSEGMKHTRRMLAGGSNIVGGVNPRKAGESVDVDGKSLPVFGTVSEAVKQTGANVSVIFVPRLVSGTGRGFGSALLQKHNRCGSWPFDILDN